MPPPATTAARADSVGIAIIGAGTVGGGVLDLLTTDLRERCGKPVVVVAIAVRRLAAAKKRLSKHYAKLLTTNWQQAINHQHTDIVVELMGGTDEAVKCIRAAIKLGKPVVTANKESHLPRHSPHGKHKGNHKIDRRHIFVVTSAGLLKCG